MGLHRPPQRQELKDRYFCKNYPACGSENHVIVTYDPQRNHSKEEALCWNCRTLLHEEDCFLIWIGKSRRVVERYAGQAARLRRAL
jgi:hypothetical protein